jgi:predicted nucleic acid-binding protein
VAHYLADSSIWIGAQRNPGTYLPRLLVDRLAEDEIATCVPVALEVLVGPPSAVDLERDWETVWRHLRWLPLTDAVASRSLELLRGLARQTAGAHRRRPIDYLVAACAEAADDVVLWHWDRDLAAICEQAGIEHEAEHERARQAGLASRHP